MGEDGISDVTLNVNEVDKNTDLTQPKASSKIRPSQTDENEGLDDKILKETITNIDKDIFFSAQSAYRKTANVIKKRVEVMMLSVYEAINAAINRGDYSVKIALTKEQRKFLEAKGFRIRMNAQNSNTCSCDIYWN